MGLFDNVRCDIQLGGEEEYPDVYQTKDLGQSLMMYVISENGLLYVEQNLVDDTEELVRDDYTGTVSFYEYGSSDRKTWIEFEALFRRGMLVELKQVFPTPRVVVVNRSKVLLAELRELNASQAAIINELNSLYIDTLDV